MFAGSDEGAQRAAILYTVISTAVLFAATPWPLGPLYPSSRGVAAPADAILLDTQRPLV